MGWYNCHVIHSLFSANGIMVVCVESTFFYTRTANGTGTIGLRVEIVPSIRYVTCYSMPQIIIQY